jgi:hypothetical protein
LPSTDARMPSDQRLGPSTGVARRLGARLLLADGDRENHHPHPDARMSDSMTTSPRLAGFLDFLSAWKDPQGLRRRERTDWRAANPSSDRGFGKRGHGSDGSAAKASERPS